MVGVTHDELRALCKAATPGPWNEGYWDGRFHVETREILLVQDMEPVDDKKQAMQNATYIAAVSPDVVLGLLDEIARLAPSPSREACCWPCFKDLNQSDGVADLYAEREDEYVAACGICGHDMEG